MLFQTRFRCLWLAVSLLMGYTAVEAQTPVPGQNVDVKKQADSIAAVVGSALLNKDSALLVSIFSDTVGILMPGKKTLTGKGSVAKYASLLFKTVGGGKLETKRTAAEKIKGYTDLAREAGTYTLTKKSDTGQAQVWKGQYTVYWRFRENTWLIERLFVSDR